ncbi:alpha/beta-hydrolase [Peniophora sp. CONT]|nr:alpha/beta-hydrolase [Peniophora sp. CONT]
MGMYDKTPVYEHFEDHFWAHEPWKTLYVLQRVLVTMLLVPGWVLYYGIMPRRYRPRPSWSIKQIIIVKFMKRVSRVVEVAGVTWGTHDPTVAPDPKSLKETRFEWVPELTGDLRTGIVDDPHVECKPVGTYIWPKEPKASTRMRGNTKSVREKQSTAQARPDAADLENDAADAPPRLVGIYLHGGGYCHYSAHESSGTSRVPRRLVEDGLFQEIHSVEYRLLQHAPVPAAIQDAAAVYANLVINELGAKKGPDGRYYLPETNCVPHSEAQVVNLPESLTRAEARAQKLGERPDPVPLPTHQEEMTSTSPGGMASGPPLAKTASKSKRHSLSLSRTKSPEKRHSIDSVQPMFSGNDAIPTIHIDAASEDHLASSGDSTTLAPRSTPGTPYPEDRLPRGRHRTKIILIGDSSGGNLALALARWVRDEGLLPPPDGMLLLSPSCDPSHTLPQVPASRRPRPHENTDYLLDTPEPRALLQRTFLGHHPPEFVYSPYISPSSEWVLSVFHGTEAGMEDLETIPAIRNGEDTRTYTEGPGDCAACDHLAAQRPIGPARTMSSNPYIADPSGQGLFTNFPRALITVGDAERLEREVLALERGMERDGVRVRMVWAKDGCHDLLILASWDEKVREGIWVAIHEWVREIENDP